MNANVNLLVGSTVAAQQYSAEFTGSLCSTACANSSVKPTANVSYTVGTPYLLNAVEYVPIVAVVTVTYKRNGCNCLRTDAFSTSFNIAFPTSTLLTPTITAGANVNVDVTGECCSCRVKDFDVTCNFSVATA